RRHGPGAAGLPGEDRLQIRTAPRRMIWSLWLKNKDGIAVIEPGHTWTVSEITAAAERLEVTGPVVPICEPNSAAWITQFLAAQRIGATVLPLDPLLPAAPRHLRRCTVIGGRRPAVLQALPAEDSQLLRRERNRRHLLRPHRQRHAHRSQRRQTVEGRARKNPTRRTHRRRPASARGFR